MRSESDQKAEVLADLLAAATPQHYDVSVPGQPTTTSELTAPNFRGRVADARRVCHGFSGVGCLLS